MKWTRFMIYYYFLLVTLFQGCICQNEESFDTSLFQAINAQNGDKSWVISPVSIRAVLEEIYFGAGGDTKKQLAKTLGITNDSQITDEQADLNVTPDPGVVWKMANWILVKNNFPLLPSYKNKVSSLFHSEVNNKDFSDPNAISNTINSLVSNLTEGLITHLISPEDIGPTTVMILLNAVYFVGTWRYKFDNRFTTKQCFYQKPGNCILTDMMKQENFLYYGEYEQLDVQVVKLPYNDTRYTMVLVLPNKIDGLSEVVEKLPNSQLLDFIRNMNDTKRIQLTMPKFTTRFHKRLNTPLQKIGLTSMFQKQSANFSALSDETGIYVNEVIHEAYISVTENGTKAGGATGSIYWRRQLNDNPFDFTADHPFIYFLMSNSSIVLFSGQYQG